MRQVSWARGGPSTLIQSARTCLKCNTKPPTARPILKRWGSAPLGKAPVRTVSWDCVRGLEVVPRQLRQPVELTFGPVRFDCDILALDVASIFETLAERT